MRVIRSPLFLDDLSEAYAHLAPTSTRAADRLLAEVEALVERLRAFPELGRPRQEIEIGIRSFRVRVFRYLLFYRVEQDALRLLRLLHTARDLSRQQIG